MFSGMTGASERDEEVEAGGAVPPSAADAAVSGARPAGGGQEHRVQKHAGVGPCVSQV